MRFALYAFSAAAAAMLAAAPANAEVKMKLQEVAGGLTHPLAMVSIPDGSGRIAVIEQHGVVRIIDTRGRLLPEPFLNIQARIPQLHPFFDERGLLGHRLPPELSRERQVLHRLLGAAARRRRPRQEAVVVHTNTVSEIPGLEGRTRTRPTRTVERIVSQIDWPQFNHNGHWIGFGPDGKLYVSTGDGGYANDWGIGHNVTNGNGQDLSRINGKMLRIDVDKPTISFRPTIPSSGATTPSRRSGPTACATRGAAPSTWAATRSCSAPTSSRTRSRKSTSSRRAATTAGAGWKATSASTTSNPNTHPASCDKTGLTDPILVYTNCTAVPQDCMGISVTGGYVYRGSHRAVAGQVHLRRLVEGVRRHGRPDLRRDQGRRRQVDDGKGDGAEA